MRRLLLILMIALLPLRTWAGDVMAVQMLTPSSVTQSTEVSVAAVSAHGMQMAEADCPGHGSIAAETPPKQHSGAPCSTCTTCQICHSVAIPVLALALIAPTSFAQAPPSEAPSFTSAEPALSQKPPIS